MAARWAFWVGTFIIILTTLNQGYYIPSLNSEIQNIDGKIGDVERKLIFQKDRLQEFQNLDSRGINFNNFKFLLETMGKQKTPQYDAISWLLLTTRIQVIMKLYNAATGEHATEELEEKLKGMGFKELEQEKSNYYERYNLYNRSLVSEKTELQDKKREKSVKLSNMSLYGSIIQSFGLVLLALSQILSKKESENAGTSGEERQGKEFRSNPQS